MKIRVILSKLGLIYPGVLGTALLGSVFAVGEVHAEEINPASNSSVLEQIEHHHQNSLGQVNQVYQLRDVAPGHWAYEALRNLIERYGCMRGYPDRTFRGNQGVTRYEFAVTLNECLQKIEQLITANERGTPSSTTPRVNNSDLRSIQRLTDEFTAELAILGTRVDDLEGKVDFLEDHQFSTTTTLEGKVIFAGLGVLGGEQDNSRNIDREIAFGYRARLNFDTSFTGRDVLRTRLQADGLVDPNINTGEGDLFFAEEGGDGNIVVDALVYAFPIGDNTEIAIAANAGAADDFASTVNFLDGDGNDGALTTFGTRHPIYYLIEQAGVGVRHEFSEQLELSVGYMATDPSNPGEGNGLFNGGYGTMAQLVYKPNERLNIGFTYLNAYNTETGTGSNRSNLRTFTENKFEEAVPTSSNAYGVELSWHISDRFVLGGWGGYINTTALSSLNGQISRGSLDIWNWAVTLAFPDLGKEGSLGGVIIGMEPKVTGSSITGVHPDPDTSLHIEAFYQYQVNDNIAIAPGLVWLTAPDHNSNNDSVVIGTIRTTFSF